MSKEHFFMFSRRAKNASFSNRTCKLGQLHGTFKEALKKANDLCLKEQAEITVTDYDTNLVVIVLRRSPQNANALLHFQGFEELIV